MHQNALFWNEKNQKIFLQMHNQDVDVDKKRERRRVPASLPASSIFKINELTLDYFSLTTLRLQVP